MLLVLLFGFAVLFTAVLLILSGLALDLVTETLAFLSGMRLSGVFAGGGVAFFGAGFAFAEAGVEVCFAGVCFAGACFALAGFAAGFATDFAGDGLAAGLDFAAGFFVADGLPFADFAAGAAFFTGFAGLAAFFGAGFGAGFFDFAFGAALAVFFAISVSCEISALNWLQRSLEQTCKLATSILNPVTTPLSEFAHATR